jgi:hypothetical protein
MNITGTRLPPISYTSNVPAASVVSALLGISAMIWLGQCIKYKCQPPRMSILIFLSHLCLFVEMILRAVLSPSTRRAQAATTVTNILLAINHRLIILAIYDFLVRLLGEKQLLSRLMLIGSLFIVLSSAVLMIPAGIFAFDGDRIRLSFQLRQASTIMILILMAAFYPLWITVIIFERKKHIGRKISIMAFILLLVSSICCLVLAIFLVVTAWPKYFVAVGNSEIWFYGFNLIPMAITLFMWNICHPKRSLAPLYKTNEHIEATLF